MFEGIAPREQWTITPMNASTDSGDVSQIMPMNLFTAASWTVGVAPHTWQATACSGSTLGEKSAHWAAGVMAATAYDILTMPEEREKIRKEFQSRRVEDYTPMLAGE